jgi:hypothetical protein
MSWCLYGLLATYTGDCKHIFNSIMIRVVLVMDIDTGVLNYHVIGEGFGGKFPISGGDNGSTHVAHLQRKSVIAKHYNFWYFKGCIAGTTAGIGMARDGDNNKTEQRSAVFGKMFGDWVDNIGYIVAVVKVTVVVTVMNNFNSLTDNEWYSCWAIQIMFFQWRGHQLNG